MGSNPTVTAISMSQDMIPNEPPDLRLGVRCSWPIELIWLYQVLRQNFSGVTVSDSDDGLVNQEQNWRSGIASSGSKFVKDAPSQGLNGAWSLVVEYKVWSLGVDAQFEHIQLSLEG